MKSNKQKKRLALTLQKKIKVRVLTSSEGNVIADTDEDGLCNRKRDKLDIDSYFEKISSKGRK